MPSYLNASRLFPFPRAGSAASHHQFKCVMGHLREATVSVLRATYVWDRNGEQQYTSGGQCGCHTGAPRESCREVLHMIWMHPGLKHLTLSPLLQTCYSPVTDLDAAGRASALHARCGVHCVSEDGELWQYSSHQSRDTGPSVDPDADDDGRLVMGHEDLAGRRQGGRRKSKY